MLEPGRDGPVAGSPVDAQLATFIASVVEWVEGDLGGRVPGDRRDGGAGLVHPLEELDEVVEAGPADA